MDTVGIWAAALPSALMMVIVMLGVATIDTLGGLDGIDPAQNEWSE